MCPLDFAGNYNTLINNINFGIYRFSPGSGRFVRANQAMLGIFGYESVTDFLEVKAVELFRNPEELNRVFEELKQSRAVKTGEIPMRRKDGTPVWCLLTVTAEYGDRGDIKWLDGVVEDVTERKRSQEEQQKAVGELEMQVRERLADLVAANEMLTTEIAERRRIEEQLREQYHFLEVLINAIPSPVFYKDAAGIYQGCNGAFEKYMGLSREQIVGKTDYEMAPEEQADKYRAIDQSLMADPGTHDFETNFLDAEGREHDIIIIKTAYLKEEGEVGGVIGIMVDITDLRKLEEEQLKMEKLESLGLLAGGIAHDFNNIITGILGNISLARIFIDPLHRSSRHLEEAEKASQRAAELAHQLLTFAKGGSPIKKMVTVRRIVDESVSFILRGANVEGIVEIPESLHAVEADEGQIRQAFGNIILNAVQAMPGGGTLRISAEEVELNEKNEFALLPGEYVKISFSDEGCGISEENRKKIFDPYFTTKADGTGLGLSSTYSIIKRHGGFIDLHSVIGEGTTFACYLPSTGETIPEHRQEEDSFGVDEHGGGTVLVMDDEEMIRTITVDMLDYLGYDATTCATGEEAISLYRAAYESGAPFFAVIMDLTIPGGMGGKEAAQKILEFDPDARLIVSSGYSVDPVMAQYGNFGFSAAVVKPYEAMEISAVLSNVRAKSPPLN
jgi:two-component system, cell cycle sensor histidine kinase and response regulator CckA